MIYQLLYNRHFNKLYRNVLKTLLPFWKWKKKIPVSGVLRLKLVKDRRLLIATNPTSFASKHIFWLGLDQFEYVPIFKRLIKQCNNFIDIGANTGIYSTLGATINPNLAVIAFEPSIGPFTYLKKNIELNKLTEQIEAHQLALSNKAGTADFHEVANKKYTFLDYNLGGVGNLNQKIAHRNMITSVVKTDTLDNFIRNTKADLKTIDLIKIDTEGTEHYILEGMASTLSTFRPIIICETLFNKIEDKIEDIMKQHEYLFFNHYAAENKLVQVDSIKRHTDNSVRDCFLVPVEKVDWIKSFL